MLHSSPDPEETEAGPRSERSANPPIRPSLGVLLGAVAIGILWLQLIWFLRLSWSSESYYNYGWLVPIFTGALLFQRFKLSNASRENKELGKTLCTGLIALICLAFVGFLFARLLIEISPFWRRPLWLAAICLISISVAFVALSYGPKVAKRCLFPFLFSLTMVPWPTFAEKWVITGFTSFVTKVCVEALHWIGHPAVQMGNIIQVGNATVGVEEACSGIKSLQALLMISLFVGAYWTLKTRTRVALVVLAIGLSMLFNLARSLVLSVLVINGGDELFNEWHDTIGYTAFSLAILTLFGIALKMSNATDSLQESVSTPTNRLSRKAGVAAVCLSFIPIVFPHIWFGDADDGKNAAIQWYIDVGNLDIDELASRELPINERVAEILGYDYGHHLALFRDDRFISEVWYYGFTGESKSKSLLAYSHSPTICMTSAGARLTHQLDPLSVDLGLIQLPLQHYTFELPNGQTSQVFWCLWDDLYQGHTDQRGENALLAEFVTTFERKRSFKRKVILLGIPMSDPELARREVTKITRDLILLEKDGETIRFN